VVQVAGDLGIGGRQERRPVPLPGRSVESELADGERAATDIGERAVHESVGVGKDAQLCDFRRQPGDILVSVAVANAEQDQQAGSDLPAHGPVDGYRRFAYPLDQRSHSLWSLKAAVTCPVVPATPPGAPASREPTYPTACRTRV